LTPHGIIVNSSNIGAVLIAARWAGSCGRLPRLLQFGSKPVLGLRQETSPARDRLPLGGAGQPFRRYSASSLSIGYELHVTAVQLARAYLSLLSGRQRGCAWRAASR